MTATYDPIVGQVRLATEPPVLPFIDGSPTGYRMTEDGTPVVPSGVFSIAGGEILMQNEEAEFAATNVSYDGSGPPRLNATGGALQPFDLPVPFP